MITRTDFDLLIQNLEKTNTKLVAVSKLKDVTDILELHEMGQLDFGENYVQEMVEKHKLLPEDIRWHFIGHLQSNKVKYIAPFVHLIHGVDSFKLLLEINKQAQKHNRVIQCLLQVHIADEETKYGLDEKECMELLEFYSAQKANLHHVAIRGLMGMASFSENRNKVAGEFRSLRALFDIIKQSYFLGDNNFSILSMGMSGDYDLAIAEGSTLVRVGSLLFGARRASL